MDQLATFFQDRWLVIVIAVIVLFLVIKIVKTVVKWVIVLAVLAGLFYYGATYTDKIKDVGGSVMNGTKEAISGLKEEALKTLAGKDAKYKQNPDGTFTITANQVKLDGKLGSDEVKVTVAGQSFTMKVDDALKTIIEAAKKNG